ncbi:MAG TPA: hypothetical protein DIT07_11610 [Sphingobacteriaceae bacterium]|nr:hypothetical protein [Sphingobacteriaceae bacterium]
MNIPDKPAESILRILIDIRNLLTERRNPGPVIQQEAWLDSCDIRNIYKISKSTLYRLKKAKILNPSSLGGKDMYCRSEIEKIFQRRKLQSV